ncbi:hypothetical protein L210DRAFT_788583, partial [Boletus edulis BED1]
WVQADFGEFINLLLGDVHAAAVAEEVTLDDQKKHLEDFFTGCLQQDFKTYRTTKWNCPVPQPVNQVLSNWQCTIHQELVW